MVSDGESGRHILWSDGRAGRDCRGRMSNRAYEFTFQTFKNVLYWKSARKEGDQVADEEKMTVLEEENRRLREDNEKLMDIVVQMRVTLNRLVLRYVTEEG